MWHPMAAQSLRDSKSRCQPRELWCAWLWARRTDTVPSRQYPYACGCQGDSDCPYICVAAVATRYQPRLRGPLLDRSVIHAVPRVQDDTLAAECQGEASSAGRERVTAARADPHRHRADRGAHARPARWRRPAVDASGHAPVTPRGAGRPLRAETGWLDHRLGRSWM